MEEKKTDQSSGTEFAQYEYSQQYQPELPNSTAVLVLGILSLVFMCMYGGGLILGIIALVISSRAKKKYFSHLGKYSLSSYKNMRAGRPCAIIGVSLSAVFALFIVLYFVFVGALIGGALIGDGTF